jgi:hypothetical protein
LNKEELRDRLSQKDSVYYWTALCYILFKIGITISVLKNPDGQTATTIEEKKTLIRRILFSLALIAEAERLIPSERVY